MTTYVDRLLPEPDEDERLKAVLATAAAMPDRRGGLGFLPVRDRADEGPVTAWLERAAGPHAAELRDYLHRTGRDLATALRPVTWAAGSQPDWVDALITFLLAHDDGGGNGVRAAATALYDGPRHVMLTPAARAALDDTLARRLIEACHATGLASSRAAWLAALERTPALARVIGVTCAQWAAATREMFLRLEQDWPLVRAALWDGTDPGAVVEFRGDAGDRHGGGVAVALLGFAGGQSVAYKPKELAHVAALQSLITFLNDSGLPLALRTRGVLDRGSYGWEERIVGAPCTDTDGFARYYRRLGMITRLMQLLAGRDLWADNLIAAGDQPMFIDLECLLTATVRMTSSAQHDADQHEAIDALNASAVTSAIVMQPWSAPLDLPVLDVGCLSDVGSRTRGDGSPILPLPPYRPFTTDRTADASRHADEVLAGYRQMHDLLLRNRKVLGDPAGPLAPFRGVVMRHIRRDTMSCYALIRASVSCGSLRGGVAREVALAGLLRSVFTTPGVCADRPDLVEMSLSEVDALRGLDVALFRSRTDSTTVYGPAGAPLGEHFADTAWDALMCRVTELDSFDLDRHVAILASAIDAARDGAERGHRTSARFRVTGTTPSTDELIAAAVSIGDRILSVRTAGGDLIGQTWQPVTGVRDVEVLGPDLGSGTAGIAVVLAELFAVTGHRRFRAASLDLLDRATGFAAHLPAGAQRDRIAGTAFVPGGFAGAGAVVHALARCAARMHDDDPLTAAVGLLPPIATALDAPPSGARRPCTDLPAGLAGLLANLLRLREQTSSEPTVDELLTQLAHLLACPSTSPKYALAAGRVVPAGRDSVVAALARFAALTPHLAGEAVDVVTDHHFGTDDIGSLLAHADASRALPARVSAPQLPQVALPTLSCRQLLDFGGLAAIIDRPAAVPFGAALLHRHRSSGGWFPDRYAHDDVNLGFLDGVGAVALFLMQLADPAVLPITTLH